MLKKASVTKKFQYDIYTNEKNKKPINRNNEKIKEREEAINTN